MELKQLQSFVEVVRCGSFTRAAAALFLSQPTVSAHVQALETELGCRLIVRTTKRLEITPKGREIYDYAVRMLDMQQRMLLCCGGDVQQIIRLGASTLPAAYLLPELLPQFTVRYPDTYFTVTQDSSERIADGLSDGLYDLGLIALNVPECLTCIPFCTDRTVLITPVHPRYLSLCASPHAISTLLTCPFILREQGSGRNAERLLQKLGVDEEALQVVARLNDLETVKNMVAGGLGVSLLSERAARSMVQANRLLQFELPLKTHRSLYLAHRRDLILQPHVRAFADFLQQAFAQEGAYTP